MAEFTLTTPRRIGNHWFRLSTEEQAREAFYSHEQLIRLAGRHDVILPTDPTPRFEWCPSPTFGTPLKVPVTGGGMSAATTVTTSCIRTEFVMIAYAYVISIIRNTHREYADLMERTTKSSHTREDADEIRDICARVYTAYLILVDRIKPHVILHTIGNLAPVCAELSVHTANALIAYVAGFHTAVGFTILDRIQGKPVSFKDRCRVFLFVARQYECCYSIFTQYVWPIFGVGTPEQTAFQRYILGSSLFFRAKAFVCAAEAEKSLPNWNPATILVLARKADFILRILTYSPAFGFEERAGALRQFTVKWIASAVHAVRPDFPLRDKIENVKQYLEGDRFIALVIDENDTEGLLAIGHRKQGRFFRSDPRYCSIPRKCLFRSSAADPTLTPTPAPAQLN